MFRRKIELSDGYKRGSTLATIFNEGWTFTMNLVLLFAVTMGVVCIAPIVLLIGIIGFIIWSIKSIYLAVFKPTPKLKPDY